MDRVIVYPGQAPRSLDLLSTNRNAMIAVGMLLSAVMGAATVVDGLAISPTAPASLQVQVGQGAIYALQPVDPNAYSSLGPDTGDLIVKQGLIFGTTLLTLTPPPASGQSQTFLVQAAFQEVDGGPVLLPYYNASAPAQPWQGPNNAGTTQYTVRQGQCVIGLKAGVAAATGSQTAPAADAGYVGLYTITLANGATTVTSANIAVAAGAPFLPVKLPAVPSGVQSGRWVFVNAVYSGGNYLGTLTPAPSSLVQGMEVLALFGTANNVTTPNLNLNGIGYNPILKQSGALPQLGDLTGYVPLVFDGANWRVNGPAASDVRQRLQATLNLYVATTGSDAANSGLSAASPFATLQRAVTAAQSLDWNGQAVVVYVAAGTYGAGAYVSGPFTGANGTPLSFVGNPSTPANVVVANTTSGPQVDCFCALNGGQLSVSGFQVSSTYGCGVHALGTGSLAGYSNMNFGACSGGAHGRAELGAELVIQSGAVYGIVGGANAHFAVDCGGIIRMNGAAIAPGLSGTPAFSGAFAIATNNGLIEVPGLSFSGAATGVRYYASCSLINTGGGGANYFPGNTAGSTATSTSYA